MLCIVIYSAFQMYLAKQKYLYLADCQAEAGLVYCNCDYDWYSASFPFLLTKSYIIHVHPLLPVSWSWSCSKYVQFCLYLAQNWRTEPPPPIACCHFPNHPYFFPTLAPSKHFCCHHLLSPSPPPIPPPHTLLSMNKVHWRSHLSRKPLMHTLSGLHCARRMWKCGIWRRRACVLKKTRDECEGWGKKQKSEGKYDGVPLANKAPTVCLLPGSCGSTREREGRRDLSGSEGGWLNDSISPFQLQQLPIYIVMQIQCVSQMVLFQHRGCIKIWLFIHSALAESLLHPPSLYSPPPLLSPHTRKDKPVLCIISH